MMAVTLSFRMFPAKAHTRCIRQVTWDRDAHPPSDNGARQQRLQEFKVPPKLLLLSDFQARLAAHPLALTSGS
jgi:hypothetical protein